MLKVAHRINTLAQLREVPAEQGIELDLRYEGKELILHHDPFETGERFEDLLKEYRHALIILNVKTEGIEAETLRLLKKYKVNDYFFLDLSLPFLVKYVNNGLQKVAVRFSEYEPMEFVLSFAGKIDWVWVDCFNHLPLNSANYAYLKRHFKICIVSPELHGHPLERIEAFKKQLTGMPIDAVCTKRPDLW